MFDIKKIITKALLAVTFAMGASAAWAGPSYHVVLDATQFNVQDEGTLYFSFNSLQASTSALATVTNFTGNYNYEVNRSGSVNGQIPNTVKFSNSGADNALIESVFLGGIFSFDINFSGDYETTPGSFGALFGVALANDATGEYVGTNGNLLEFLLQPITPTTPPTVDVNNPTRIVTVTPLVPPTSVPEPSDLLLVMTGLGLVAFVRRRATKAAR